MTITIEQAKTVYIAVSGDKNRTEHEWEDIHNDMEAVINAPSLTKAGKAIEWWDCWIEDDTATDFAAHVRQEWRKMQEGLTMNRIDDGGSQ